MGNTVWHVEGRPFQSDAASGAFDLHMASGDSQQMAISKSLSLSTIPRCCYGWRSCTYRGHRTTRHTHSADWNTLDDSRRRSYPCTRCNTRRGWPWHGVRRDSIGSPRWPWTNSWTARRHRPLVTVPGGNLWPWGNHVPRSWWDGNVRASPTWSGASTTAD